VTFYLLITPESMVLADVGEHTVYLEVSDGEVTSDFKFNIEVLEPLFVESNLNETSNGTLNETGENNSTESEVQDS
jgi:hypothetical protein